MPGRLHLRGLPFPVYQSERMRGLRCPTEAIFYEDDLPDEWAWYKDAAVSFFAEVGDMGGASAAGPIGKDPEQVAALPPQNQ